MAKLSDEEKAQLDALRAKEEAPEEEPEGQGDGDDGGHVVVLRGKRADTFLESLIGPAPAKKAAPKKAAPANPKGQPASTEGDGAPEEDGDGAAEEETPKPPNRYFR